MLTSPIVGDEDLDKTLVKLLESGERLSVYAYRAPDGSVPVEETLARLKRHHQHLESGYGTRWQRMAQEGPERLLAHHYHKWTKHKDPRMERVHGAFKDLKSKTRIPCFADGKGRMILTHVIEGKNEDELKEADKRETLRIIEEYDRRKTELKQKSAPRTTASGRRH